MTFPQLFLITVTRFIADNIPDGSWHYWMYNPKNIGYTKVHN